MNKDTRRVAWALLTPPRAWRRKASAPSRTHFYDEDGIYLDSLPASGRGCRPACLARAVASAVTGGIHEDGGSAYRLTDCPKWFERERVDTAELSTDQP